ncbi:MAG TPA: hypothetical protein VK255_00575 [Patescibacteria group bacterium]|nr:hypothetical protein [Patescibacteria group bacterium]
MDDKIIIAVISAVSALLGALIGGGFGYFGTKLSQKNENERRKRELLFKSALEEWNTLFSGILSGKTKQKKITSLDTYIIHYSLLSKFIFNEDFNIDDVKEFLNISRKITTEYEICEEEKESNQV